MNIDFEKLLAECTFTTARSSGSGGQNVNKVETKVHLLWDVHASEAVSNEQKKRIAQKLQNRINKEGVLQVASNTERSQFLNKQAAIQKFKLLFTKALKKEKKRIATQPSAQSRQKRLDNKKRQSEKKKLRTDPSDF